MFFVDSVTRVTIQRKLPKLYKWLESKYHGINNKTSKFESFQFFKFHGLGKITNWNMFPIIFGDYYGGELDPSKAKRLNTFFKEKGFITGHSINICDPEIFSIYCEHKLFSKLNYVPNDHELWSIFCDPNHSFPLHLKKEFGEEMIKGLNSIFLRCLYNEFTSAYSIEYTLQFFDKYKNNAKFFRLEILDGHESTQESIKYSDNMFLEFFKKMELKGHLDNTIVYILSDHGLSMPSQNNLFGSEDWIKEHLLPNLIMLMPKNIENYEVVKENLIHNENALITPFNIRYSFEANVGNENDENIFFNKISWQRKCDFQFYYDVRDFCRCNT